MASFLFKPSNCVGAWICAGRLDSLTVYVRTYYFRILYVVAVAESLVSRLCVVNLILILL